MYIGNCDKDQDSMQAPCQKIVWDVLPAIKAAIVVELVKCGVSQSEASRMLEIAPSAASQYLSGKRGYRIELADEVRESIAGLALDLKEQRVDDLVGRICAICRQLREEKDPCVQEPDRCGSRISD